LAFMNQAALYSKQEDSLKALECYQKAKPYLSDDMLLKELMAYHYLFIGKTDEGKRLLQEVNGYISDCEVTAGTLPDDYLSGKVDEEGIRTIFISVDETRESIVKKREAIEKVLEKWPQFRDGWLNLATTWMQLHREKEALAALEKFWKLHPYDPSAAYYLSALYAERMDYVKAWAFLQHAEALLKAAKHQPKVLTQYRRQLEKLFPE
jgi:tetratricopeptide (TPR) repeat protein